MLLEPGQMQVWPAILLRMLSSPNDRFKKKKRRCCGQVHPCGYTQTSLKTYLFLVQFFTFCVLLYLFHATLINSYMLNLFNHSIHNSSDAPCFRGLHTFWTNGSFFLYLDNCIFILILLYFLVFCFSPKNCRYCFSEVQLLTI